jgi:hypothetical protein
MHACFQDVRALLDAEAVRCVFIQDNPAFDGLRASLGLRRSAHSASAAGAQACITPAARRTGLSAL